MSAEPTAFTDRFHATQGRLVRANGERLDVQVSFYWSISNPLAYVIGVREPGSDLQEAWEVARSLFLAADHPHAGGGFVGRGDFCIGYNAITGNAVLYFKPAHEPREAWAQVGVPAHEVRKFVEDTFSVTDGSAERDVIDRQIELAIDRCLSARE